MAVKVADTKLANRAYLFSPKGAIAAKYDKIHMFDVDLPSGESYRESRRYVAGDKAVVAPLPWGNLGITICYDMRFPGLYRTLAKAGADFLTMPSAFTVPTGKAHWHTLLRARAIEAQCFVLAAAQGGKHDNGRETYGHSLVVSPWGEVLAEGGTEPGVIFADIDPAKVAEARARVPSLEHDRPFSVATDAAGCAGRAGRRQQGSTRIMIRYRLICGGVSGEPEQAAAVKKAGSKGTRASSVRSPSRTAPARAAAKKVQGCGHEFESWFQNGDAFDTLVKRGQVTCPGCGSRHVEKALMAPSVKTTKGKRRQVEAPEFTGQPNIALPAQAVTSPTLATLTPEQRAFVDTMRKAREHVLATSENVGKKFVEEARKMHYEEAETRSIHGEASIEEAKALSDEGIDIFPIPVLPDDRN